jgi:hypothetical protein
VLAVQVQMVQIQPLAVVLESIHLYQVQALLQLQPQVAVVAALAMVMNLAAVQEVQAVVVREVEVRQELLLHHQSKVIQVKAV